MATTRSTLGEFQMKDLTFNLGHALVMGFSQFAFQSRLGFHVWWNNDNAGTATHSDSVFNLLLVLILKNQSFERSHWI